MHDYRSSTSSGGGSGGSGGGSSGASLSLSSCSSCSLDVSKSCVRCSMVNRDPATGGSIPDVLHALSTCYFKNGGTIKFGRYLRVRKKEKNNFQNIQSSSSSMPPPQSIVVGSTIENIFSGQTLV